MNGLRAGARGNPRPGLRGLMGLIAILQAISMGNQAIQSNGVFIPTDAVQP